MTDRMRRSLLGGVVMASAGLAVGARAQSTPPLASNPPQGNPDAQALQRTLENYDDTKTLEVVPVGQDWANLHRYRAYNFEMMKMPPNPLRTVMMGDSITDNWPGLSADFFQAHSLVGRGIGGQTTAQMVLRFAPDVIRLKPAVVHILAGTNDIAENLDPYDPVATTNNLQTMASLAKANGIKVVMGSVPPATSFAWRPALGNRVDMIIALNKWIKNLCLTQGHTYVDYWPVLASPDGSLKPELGLDSVHPNAAGYALMGPLAVGAIELNLASKSIGTR